jgi:peptide/bleomycin uptake transporter
VVFFAHQGYRAWLKKAINDWYKTFYDVLQTHIEREVGSGAEEELSEMRRKVWGELVNFCVLVAPAVVIHPVASFIRNHWAFAWRKALIESYLNRWDVNGQVIEGAAQRVHEDTQRFGAAIHSILATVLDSILTLAIFLPLLHDKSETLMIVALVASFGGIGVSAVVGQHIVMLEVANQRVEGALRTQLVQLELDPSNVRQYGSILSSFYLVIQRLVDNYHRLYKNFAAFNTWLSLYDQVMIVVPYMVCAPLLFASDPDKVFTLGTLTSATNAFEKVFSSIAVVSENWMSLAEFLSVIHRLREFEKNLVCKETRTVAIEFADCDTSPGDA